MKSDRVGLITHPACALHDPGPGHPERAARLQAIVDRLEAGGLWVELDRRAATPATPEALELVHPAEYVEHVRERIAAGATFVDSADANVGPASFEAARASAGGLLSAIDLVEAGEWRGAMALVRPPGHHAERALAMGFCLFNNVAIGARHLQRAHGRERIAIVDWDVHHGNGTQHLFEEDPTVFYASLHESPHYPGTGAADERGRGAGEGTTLNCPMPARSGEAEWLAAFEGQVLPALDAFRPDALLVSAGFDAHERDPLSSTRLQAETYARMTEGLLEIAARHCGGRIVSVLEGGYDLVGLSSSTEAHLGALLAAPNE